MPHKSGQIPRFGEWEDANEMPITQYFENPRQAGLIRNHHHHSTTSSTSTTTTTTSSSSSSCTSAEALKLASHNPRPRQTVVRKEKRGPQRRVRDVVSAQNDKYYVGVTGGKDYPLNDVAPTSKQTKPVDEDLYKIPPELIHSSTKKKMPGFLACLVPCSS